MTTALPELTEQNAFFWNSGADGLLRIQRCEKCALLIHPPSAICPHCLERNLAPQVVSGLATVEAVTVNYQAWIPNLEVPYAIARVSLVEDPTIYLTTRIVGIEPTAVSIGMRVKVRFEQREDVYLPFFEPA